MIPNSCPHGVLALRSLETGVYLSEARRRQGGWIGVLKLCIIAPGGTKRDHQASLGGREC